MKYDLIEKFLIFDFKFSLYTQFSKLLVSQRLRYLEKMLKSQDGSENEEAKCLRLDKEMHENISEKKVSQVIKHKPIHKSRKHVVKNDTEKSIVPSTLTSHLYMASSLSQLQKFQILSNFFTSDSQQFYSQQLTNSQIQLLTNILEENHFPLSHIFTHSFNNPWGITLSPTKNQLISYFQILNQVKSTSNRIQFLSDEEKKNNFLVVQLNKGYQLVKLSSNQIALLQFRQQYMQKIRSVMKSISGKKMSQISMQVCFLFYALKNSMKSLSSKIVHILNKTTLQAEEEKNDYESEYMEFLMKKQIKEVINDEKDIDFFNFFRDNQIIEHQLEMELGSYGQTEYDEFIRRKKNSKISKTSRSILHSACLGCLSSHNELSNPLMFCHYCGIRFHRICYKGVYYTEKNVLCLPCYEKKLGNCKKMKKRECSLCGINGLITLSGQGTNQIHIFCLLMSGLWKIENKRLAYYNNSQGLEGDHRQCKICSIANNFTFKCQICGKPAHGCCAFLEGWKMEIEDFSPSHKPQLKIQCCNNETRNDEREKRRKFVINYKKQAFKKYFSS